MIGTYLLKHSPNVCASAIGLLALAAVTAIAPPAHAVINDAGFTLNISEKEAALSDPDDPMMMKYAMWDLSFQRMVDRNMPFVELINDSDSAPITELRMTIGDTKFHFGCEMLHACAMPAESSLFQALTSSTEDNGDTLVVNFGNGGLAPGAVARFKIDLNVDSGLSGIFNAPDFRTVLFDMNSVNIYTSNVVASPEDVDPKADNSHVSAKFEKPGMTSVTARAILSDYTVTGDPALYFNNHYRRYGIMERVDTFLALGSASIVPEPPAACLTAVGLLAVAVLPRSGRKRRSLGALAAW